MFAFTRSGSIWDNLSRFEDMDGMGVVEADVDGNEGVFERPTWPLIIDEDVSWLYLLCLFLFPLWSTTGW